MAKIPKHFKSLSLIVSFISVIIVIFIGLKKLQDEIKVSNKGKTYELDSIKWSEDPLVGFQPQFIEEYLNEEQKNKVKDLIYDLNKVKENGESETVQKIQQNIILKIHEFISNGNRLEKEVNNMRDIGKINFKKYWFMEDTAYKLNSKEISQSAESLEKLENYDISIDDGRANARYINFQNNEEQVKEGKKFYNAARIGWIDTERPRSAEYKVLSGGVLAGKRRRGATVPSRMISATLSGPPVDRTVAGPVLTAPGISRGGKVKVYIPTKNDNYLKQDGHHNRLLPNRTNLYLKNTENWEDQTRTDYDFKMINKKPDIDHYYYSRNDDVPIGGETARPTSPSRATLLTGSDRRGDNDQKIPLEYNDTVKNRIYIKTNVHSDTSQKIYDVINEINKYSNISFTDDEIKNMYNLLYSDLRNSNKHNGQYLDNIPYPPWLETIDKYQRYRYTREYNQDPYFRILQKWNGIDDSLKKFPFKPSSVEVGEGALNIFPNLNKNNTNKNIHYTLNKSDKKMFKYFGFFSRFQSYR
tara:strand:- start:4679 stop:6262 length:1584 start_codon:yes stop_codon:yes gene_type:complete